MPAVPTSPMWSRISLHCAHCINRSLTVSLNPLTGFEKIFYCTPVTIAICSQLPANGIIGQLRGICCSQGGMGRKKGGSIGNKVPSPPSCQDSPGSTKVASSPVHLDKTGASTLITITAKPGAKHSSITNFSHVRDGIICVYIHILKM